MRRTDVLHPLDARAERVLGEVQADAEVDDVVRLFVRFVENESVLERAEVRGDGAAALEAGEGAAWVASPTSASRNSPQIDLLTSSVKSPICLRTVVHVDPEVDRVVAETIDFALSDELVAAALVRLVGLHDLSLQLENVSTFNGSP